MRHREAGCSSLPEGSCDHADSAHFARPLPRSLSGWSSAMRPPTPPGLRCEDLHLPLTFVRSHLRSFKQSCCLQGAGPAGALELAAALKHPYASTPGLHPLYSRVLAAQQMDSGGLLRILHGRLTHWVSISESSSGEREHWLAGLPYHARILHASTGLHGPLLAKMHEHLCARGYPHLLFI